MLAPFGPHVSPLCSSSNTSSNTMHLLCALFVTSDVPLVANPACDSPPDISIYQRCDGARLDTAGEQIARLQPFSINDPSCSSPDLTVTFIPTIRPYPNPNPLTQPYNPHPNHNPNRNRNPNPNPNPHPNPNPNPNCTRQQPHLLRRISLHFREPRLWSRRCPPRVTTACCTHSATTARQGAAT